jgi:putative hydrolase of the HAD superfamily
MGTSRFPFPKIEFFYFDLGNVIAHFNPRRACDNLAAISGKTPASIQQAVYQSKLQERYETGELTTEEFGKEVNSHLGTTLSTDMLTEALADMFTMGIEIFPLMVRLAAVGLRIGLLSNTCEAHWRHLAERPIQILDLLEPCILSYEQGCMKPDPAIYRVAASRAGVPPERIGFTDDRPENISGAREAGWQTHLYQSPTHLSQWLSRSGVPVF